MSQGYTVNTRKSQAIRTRAINIVGDANANQPRVTKCYNYNGKGHMAKQCTAKKRDFTRELFEGSDRSLSGSVLVARVGRGAYGCILGNKQEAGI
nr:hypothetical protein [Tanacetum cinerariifolium]